MNEHLANKYGVCRQPFTLNPSRATLEIDSMIWGVTSHYHIPPKVSMISNRNRLVVAFESGAAILVVDGILPPKRVRGDEFG